MTTKLLKLPYMETVMNNILQYTWKLVISIYINDPYLYIEVCINDKEKYLAGIHMICSNHTYCYIKLYILCSEYYHNLADLKWPLKVTKSHFIVIYNSHITVWYASHLDCYLPKTLLLIVSALVL